MINVDHELDSINAAGFRRANNMAERMRRRASGEQVDPEPIDQEVSEDSNTYYETQDAPTITNNRVVVSADNSENTVTIENKNIMFEIAYPYDTKLMVVGMRAMSVDVSEDSVSILMRDTVKLKLPKLEPLHLAVEGKPYKVCWAGGSHSFGKFKHISFVVIE